MSQILSIQSHVCFGYVGNRVATFSLQRLKHDVISVNTVQFSNHTGYGNWQGDIFGLEHIHALWTGIKARMSLSSIDALLTGYLGSVELAKFIKTIANEIRLENSKFVYCLDPVFGDVGRDIFVAPDLASYFKSHLIQQAEIITPNHFEMNFICGHQIKDIGTLKRYSHKLFNSHIKTILVTSYLGEECDPSEIAMVLLTKERAWIIKTPKIAFDIPPNGSGDLVAALMLDKLIKCTAPDKALNQITTQVYRVFDETKKRNQRELQLIQAQEFIDDETILFESVEV